MIERVTGVAAWDFTHRADDYGKYSIKLLISNETAKELHEKATSLHKKGLSITKVEKEIPGIPDAVGKYSIAVRTNALNAEGMPNSKPRRVDSKNHPFVGNIGNGSKVNVILKLVKYDGFGGGVTAILKGVQVVELVEYEDESASFDEVEGGFVAQESIPATTEDSSEVKFDF